MDWIKFDLHQHTKNELPADRKDYKSNYTHRNFKELLIKQKVKLKSVTNHNTINIVDHIKYALICNSLGIAYLPGVEIDYSFENNRLHAISILNPSFDIIEFSNRLEKITNLIPGNEHIVLSKEDFACLHESMEYIFIPHYMKTQGIRSGVEELNKTAEDWVFEMIENGQSIPVILENTKDYYKYTVHSILKSKIQNEDVEYAPCIMGSDSKFDNDLKREKTSLSRVKYYMNAEPTYRGLEISVRNNKTRIIHESDMLHRENHIKEIVFKPNKKFTNTQPIKLSPYLNVIIGTSGSGKTLLLNEIYNKITGQSLEDVLSSEDAGRSKQKVRPYYNVIGSDDWLELVFNSPEKQIVATQIPNVYKKIISYIHNHKNLGSLFNIGNYDSAKAQLLVFINNCTKYQDLLKSKDETKLNVEKNLDYMHKSIGFINDNKSDDVDFVLSEVVLQRIDLKNIEAKLDKLDKLITNKENITKYFGEIAQTLNTNEAKNSVTKIISEYQSLLSDLEKLRKVTYLQCLKQKQLDRLSELINSSIKSSVELLGLRAKAVNEKKALFDNQKEAIIKGIKKNLVDTKVLTQINLKYPLEIIQQTLSKDNSNETARYQLMYTLKDLKEINPLESNIVIAENRKMKLNKYQSPLDLTNTNEISKFLEFLNVEKIDVSTVLSHDLDINLQLRVNDVWKNVQDINPGDVSKVSMKYYFNHLIKNEHPDVVFIDQPENDLDKTFISDVLSEFIKETKTKIQIIITSHDPILTINSDVNTIIEAKTVENNKIDYSSYKIEDKFEGKFVTDEVAKILDGSKKNIKNRYQLYGGILRNDD